MNESSVTVAEAPHSGTAPPPQRRELLGNARDRWNRYWFASAPGYSLAAFRILFGVYLFCYFLSFAPKVNVLFSTEGIYIPYLVGDIALPPIWATSLYVFSLAVLVAIIVGFKTRLAVPLFLCLYLYFYFLNLAVKNTAYDRLNLIFLGILCFAELDRVWALHRSGKNEGPMVSVWPIRLICLQICLLYFGAGQWKLGNPQWHTGEMMRQTLIGSWGTPLGFWFVNLNPPAWFFTGLTWSVIAFELVMPFALTMRKLQPYAFAIGVSFHIAIGAFLNIPEFLNCVAAYVLFVRPEDVQRWGDRAVRCVRRLVPLQCQSDERDTQERRCG